MVTLGPRDRELWEELGVCILLSSLVSPGTVSGDGSASIATLGGADTVIPLLAEGLEIKILCLQTECFPLCCSEGGERRTTASSVWGSPCRQ